LTFIQNNKFNRHLNHILNKIDLMHEQTKCKSGYSEESSIPWITLMNYKHLMFHCFFISSGIKFYSVKDYIWICLWRWIKVILNRFWLTFLKWHLFL